MSGAVDLSVLKERAEAQRAAQTGPARSAGPAGPAPDAPVSDGPVIEVTEATFEAEVINRSTRQLVVVDLWATWGEPCKQLSPVLESML